MRRNENCLCFQWQLTILNSMYFEFGRKSRLLLYFGLICLTVLLILNSSKSHLENKCVNFLPVVDRWIMAFRNHCNDFRITELCWYWCTESCRQMETNGRMECSYSWKVSTCPENADISSVDHHIFELVQIINFVMLSNMSILCKYCLLNFT